MAGRIQSFPYVLKRVSDIASRLEYWTMRSLRRATPQQVVDFLLDKGLFIKPGFGTSAPRMLAEDYAERAGRLGIPVSGSTSLVVGFGGGYGIGVHLLELGAERVVLQDPFAPERIHRDLALPPELRDRYFAPSGAIKDERLVVVREHVHQYAARAPESVDLIFSSSVLEHVSDLQSLARGCKTLMRSGGANIHSVDLRDHYFRYPFEMLCYSETTWHRFLNASNNLSRLRIPDYRRIFDACFDRVAIEPFEWLRDEFHSCKHRIRPEFLTGDDEIDAAARVWLEARSTF